MHTLVSSLIPSAMSQPNTKKVAHLFAFGYACLGLSNGIATYRDYMADARRSRRHGCASDCDHDVESAFINGLIAGVLWPANMYVNWLVRQETQYRARRGIPEHLADENIGITGYDRQDF